MATSESIRVVQWGSGNVGRYSIATVASRPDMELVGLYVTNPDKAGRDAGEIAGTDRLGVTATSSVDEIVDLDADVVLHMPLPSLVYGDDRDADVANFVRLLESGKHVVTTVGYIYPQVHGDQLMTRLTGACERGGSVFHGTGVNPGWFGDLLPLLMSGLALRIEQISIREISNFQRYPSPEIMFDMMNFGRTPDDFAARSHRHLNWLDGLFSEAVEMVSVGLGVTTTGIGSELETWVADADLDTAAGTVAAGTIAGQRYHWSAMDGDDVIVRQETVWRMHERAAPQWPTGDWSITITGDPGMHIDLGHGWNRNMLASTAAHAINAAPYVMHAQPGIRTFLDLPLIAGLGTRY